MNKVFLSGNLTRNPEVRYAQSGKAYVKVDIAVDRISKDKATDFFHLVAFDKTAEFFGKYFSKGSRILVEGRLQTSSYKNQQCVDVTATDIMVDNVEFAGGKRDDDNATPQPHNNTPPPRTNTAPQPPRNDYGFGGEPIDPNDTPF